MMPAIDLLKSGSTAPTMANVIAPSNKEAQDLDPHIGVLLTNLQLNVEKMQEGEIRAQLAKVEALNDKMELMTSFLEVLEHELADPKKTEIDLTGQGTMLDALYNTFLPSDTGVEVPKWVKMIGDQNKFSRADCEILTKVMGRQIEQVARKVNLQTVDLNQAVEKRHEVLQIARELLKMFREFMKTLTHNQRAGM